MLRKIQALFEKVVDRIEGNPAPASRYFMLFFAILAVRLALEFFSTQRLFSLDDILHIGLWFAFIVLAFMLQLNLFSGVPMQRVARLVVVSFTIALTAPVIDLILRGGVGAKMNYLAINSWADVWHAYLTIGGASLSRGATLGIRIEIFLLVIASFNYLRTKTGSLPKAFLGTVCIYTVLFLSGTVPRLLGWIVERFQLTYQPDDRSTVLFLLVLDLLLVFFILARHSGRWMGLIFRSIPWGAVALAAVNFAIGAVLALNAYPGIWTLHPTTLFWFPLLAGLGLALAAFAGLHHLPDSIRPQENLPATSLHLQAERTAGLLRNGLTVLILGMSLAIGQKVFFAAMVVWGLLFLLNEAPLKLKTIPLLRNLLEVLAIFAVALMGFMAFGGPMIGFPGKWMLVLLLFTLIGCIGTDVQRRGDSIILWYRDWLAPWQRIFRVGTALLLLAAGGLTACILGTHTLDFILLIGLLLPPLAVQLLARRSLQWQLLAFIPLWIHFLVLSR